MLAHGRAIRISPRFETLSLKAVQQPATLRLVSRVLGLPYPSLDGRARHGAVAAENTAIAPFGLETRMACRAVVKEHASICGHGFGSALAALRASDDRLQDRLPGTLQLG